MIIFGLVTVANFLLSMILVPAYNQREFLVNIALSCAGSFLVLQMIYDKYSPKDGKQAVDIRPIFWDKLNAFQNKGPTPKMIIIFVTVILPLIIAKLVESTVPAQ